MYMILILCKVQARIHTLVSRELSIVSIAYTYASIITKHDLKKKPNNFVIILPFYQLTLVYTAYCILQNLRVKISHFTSKNLLPRDC